MCYKALICFFEKELKMWPFHKCRNWDIVHWWYVVLWFLTHPIIFGFFLAFLMQKESVQNWLQAQGWYGNFLVSLGAIIRQVIELFDKTIDVLYVGGLSLYVAIKEQYKARHHKNKTAPRKRKGHLFVGLWAGVFTATYSLIIFANYKMDEIAKTITAYTAVVLLAQLYTSIRDKYKLEEDGFEPPGF